MLIVNFASVFRYRVIPSKTVVYTGIKSH